MALGDTTLIFNNVQCLIMTLISRLLNILDFFTQYFFTKANVMPNVIKRSCARGDTICPAPFLPRGRPSASRAAEHTQHSSSFPRQIRSHVHRCTCLTR